MAKRKKPQSEYMRRKLLRKAKAEQRAKKLGKPPKPRLIRVREDKLKSMLREVTREAAQVGLATAIEHCANFWTVSDGYKKYIDYQIKSRAEELMATVRTALREELATQELARSWRPKR